MNELSTANNISETFGKFDEGEHTKVLPCNPAMWNIIHKSHGFELKNGQMLIFTKVEYAPHQDAGRFTFTISDQ